MTTATRTTTRVQGQAHQRSVFFVKPDYWIVVGSGLRPSDDKPHKYDSAFHLDMTGAEIDAASKSVQHDGCEGREPVDPSDGGRQAQCPHRLRARRSRSCRAGFALRRLHVQADSDPGLSRKRSPASRDLAYVFYPTPEGGKCPISAVEPVDVKSDGDERAVGMAVRFDDGRVDYYVQLDRPGKSRFGEFESDALVTYVRTERGHVTGAVLADGTRLTRAGEPVSADVLPIADLSRTDVRHEF